MDQLLRKYDRWSGHLTDLKDRLGMMSDQYQAAN